MRKLIVLVVLLAACKSATAREAAAACFRGFDGPELSWQLADGRPSAQVVSHSCVGDDARQGSGSERVVITAPGGESLHFICPVGRIPVLDELESRMWIKTDRPGVTLAARVVLPRSVDARSGAAQTLFVSGDECAVAGRWQQLRLDRVPNLLAAQVRVLRAASGNRIDVHEAYVDAIVLVVPGGPGNTTVWTDALEVDGVVLPAAAESISATAATPAVFSGPGLQQPKRPAPQTAPSSAARAQFQGTTLMIDDRPFLPRGIEWHNEPFAFLADRGFNTIWLDEPPTAEQSAEAAKAGVWLVCTPPAPDELAARGLGESLDRVLAWHLGRPAGPQELNYFRRWVDLVRDRDPLAARPIVIAPQGDWLPTSRLADVLLADHPAGCDLSQGDFADWLRGLPLLARPGTPLWATIATQHGPRTRGQIAALSPGAPAARDATQFDALVLAAATSGCRGFLFRADSPLDAGDEDTKRRAALVERINDRLDLIAPWLSIGRRTGEVTSADATETAIVLQAERARLLVPTTWGVDAAGDATASSQSVAFIVPGVPESNEAFLLSPVGLQTLAWKRVAGGTRVVLDRNNEGLVLMTEDPAVITGFRQRLARGGRRAAQVQYNLATNRSRSLSDSARRLQRLGVRTKSLDQAIGAASVELARVNSLLAAGNYQAAYQRSSAALRVMAVAIERERRDVATGPDLNSTPFGKNDGALVRQVELEKSLVSLRGGENQLAGGDFEDLAQLRQLGWQHIEDPMAGIQTKVQLSGVTPRNGNYCLHLSSLAAPSGSAPQLIARPLVWITSPPIRAKAGELLEISGWVRVPQPIRGSIEGLEIIDSLGGQELALRVRHTDDWQPFRMIRAANETTNVTLTFALNGLGSACVDGVMVRTLTPLSAKRLPTVTSQPASARPDSARRFLFGPPAQR